MQIQVNTDNAIHGDERLIEIVTETVSSELNHLSDRLTRVEVHLADQNAEKRGPENIRCTIEARPRGLDPMAAHDEAADITSALKGAAKKIRGRLTSEFEKIDSRR
jgi:ribosome-associated translation inhibitor RaiA